MKRIVAAIAVLASLGAVAVAQAVVVQEFSFQIKDIKKWGAYTVVFSSRSYDPSGGIPDELDQNYLRLPKGAKVNKVFKNKRFYCEAKKLVDKVRMDKGSGRFTPYLEKLLKGKKTHPQERQEPDRGVPVRAHRHGARAGGRTPVRGAPDPGRPADVLDEAGTRARSPRSRSSAFPTRRFPVVKENPTVRETVPTINVNFYSEPTPDGLYDYKLVLPTGPINGIRISVAEVNVTTTGLTYTKKTCTKKRRGKCVKTQDVKRTFWFTEPPCPPSGQLSFEAFYGYKNEPDQLKKICDSLPRLSAEPPRFSASRCGGGCGPATAGRPTCVRRTA